MFKKSTNNPHKVKKSAQRVRNGPEWTSGQKSFFIDFLIPSKLCFLQIYQKLPPCVSKMRAKIGANYW